MTLKTFLPKAGLVRYQVKRWWWVSALYALALFFSVPFILMADKEYLLSQVVRYPHMVGRILYNNAAMSIFLIAAAVLIGVCVFRYMQEVRSATLFHAMPVTRGQLFASTLLSGVVLLAMPILLNAVILFCMSWFGGYITVIPPLYILDWIGGQLLTGTATMFFCILVGTITGSSIGQLLFTFAISGAPLGAVAVSAYLLDGWLFGFVADGIEPTLEFMLKLLPYYFPQFIGRDNFVLWMAILAGVYIVVFAVLGYLLYRKRDVERAGDVAAFRWIRPIFLYAVTVCVMLAGTAFVASIMGYNGGGPNVLLLLFFALLGYAVAKMLLMKSFRIWKYYKGFVVFAVLVLLVFFAVDFNVFEFGKSVPETADVKKAYVADYYNRNWAEDDYFYGHLNGMAIFATTEGIQSVRDLHRGAIENNVARTDEDARITVYFSYVLNSGRVVTRGYEMEPYQLYALFSTDEAKDSMFPNFRKTPEKIRYISLPDLNEMQIFGEQKDELIECVQADLNRLNYQQITGFIEKTPVGELTSFPGTGEPTVTATEITDEDIKWMEENRLPIRNLEVHIITDETYRGVIGDAFVEEMDKDYTVWFSLNWNFTETINWLAENGYMSLPQ